MKYYLITYCTDYADEFDVEGMKVFTEDEFNAFVDLLLLANIAFNITPSSPLS